MDQTVFGEQSGEHTSRQIGVAIEHRTDDGSRDVDDGVERRADVAVTQRIEGLLKAVAECVDRRQHRTERAEGDGQHGVWIGDRLDDVREVLRHRARDVQQTTFQHREGHADHRRQEQGLGCGFDRAGDVARAQLFGGRLELSSQPEGVVRGQVFKESADGSCPGGDEGLTVAELVEDELTEDGGRVRQHLLAE